MLETADLVLCEDTRHTGTLLSALGIRARTEALHDHNEDARTPAPRICRLPPCPAQTRQSLR